MDLLARAWGEKLDQYDCNRCALTLDADHYECRHCGQNVGEGASLCPTCGHSIAHYTVEATP